MADTPIAAIRKNALEELRVGLSEYQGHQLVNLRVWFRSQDGDMHPGKQGVALRVDALADLVKALQDAHDEARRQGLVG